MTTQVAKLKDIKNNFSFHAEVFIGEPSYVQFIKHAIDARRSEDAPCSLQIGIISGDICYIDDEAANQCDDILLKMETFLENGDHDDLIFLEIVKTEDEQYRLIGTPAEKIDDNNNWVERLEIDKPTLEELLDSF